MTDVELCREIRFFVGQINRIQERISKFESDPQALSILNERLSETIKNHRLAMIQLMEKEQ